MRRPLIALIVTLVPAWLAGCATRSVPFRPAEPANRAAADGRPAIAYTLDGGRLGEVRVWSPGVGVAEGEATAAVGVLLRLRAARGRAMELDRDGAELRWNAVGRGRRVQGGPDWVCGRSRADDAGGDGRALLVFLLPAGVRPVDVRSFELRWAVVGDDGRRYERRTSFEPDRPDASRLDRSRPWPWGYPMYRPYSTVPVPYYPHHLYHHPLIPAW